MQLHLLAKLVFFIDIHKFIYIFYHKIYFYKGIYILVDTYMRFLERGRELIAAQVVETSCLSC